MVKILKRVNLFFCAFCDKKNYWIFLVIFGVKYLSIKGFGVSISLKLLVMLGCGQILQAKYSNNKAFSLQTFIISARVFLYGAKITI